MAKTVALVGLGAMGRRMAGQLLHAGYDLVVWNRTLARARTLLAAGARLAESPAAAARQAEAVITMVADARALEAVTDGPDGILAGLRPSATLIEMSTVGPGAVARLASRLPAGVGLLDAPVLGSLAEAEGGSLTIFVGGSAPLVEQCQPLLAALGTPLHVGPRGAGAAAKLVANATLFNTLGTLGEAIALARGLGLARDVTYQVLARTPLAAQADRRRTAIETGDFPARFPLALARKDAALIREAATTAGVELRLTRGAGEWLADAEAAGFGDHDYTAVLATILRSSERSPSSAGVPRHTGPGGNHSQVSDVDGLIVDLDGVVWRGDEPIAGAAEAIRALRARNVRVLFLTNEPRYSPAAIAARLTAMDIPATAEDVMTSATVTARALTTLAGPGVRQALVVGPSTLHDEIEKAGFTVVSLEAAREAEIVVVAAHEDFNYRELRAATTALHHGARLFATGRDPVFPTADGPCPATGAVLAAVETAGGTPALVVGKPEKIIFDIAADALTGCRRVAVVGDHLVADAAGAKRAGLAAILVLSGVTARGDLARADILPDLVLDSIAALPAVLKGQGSEREPQ